MEKFIWMGVRIVSGGVFEAFYGSGYFFGWLGNFVEELEELPCDLVFDSLADSFI